MNNVIEYVAPKQYDGAQHESKQWDLLCGGNIYLQDQDTLETSVQFDGDTNKPNLQTVISIRKTQRREEQVVLSTIWCKATGSLPQAGNDETTNLR